MNLFAPLINDVETGSTPEYPELQPQRFDAPKALVMEEIEAVCRTRLRWTVTAVDPVKGQVDAVFQTRFFRFKDDVTVRLEAAGGAGADDAGVCVVYVRSRSRVGKGDAGQNAATIRSFQAALQEAVSARLENRESGH